MLDQRILNQILRYYGELTENVEVGTLNGKFSYYFGDELDHNMGFRVPGPLIYYDVTSAFPTLCRLLFQHYPKFITRMDSIKDKRKKLIFISTHIPMFKTDMLVELNAWIKMIIFSKVFNNNENVQVLEFKKDSLLCKGTLLASSKIPELELLIDEYFKFHNDCEYDSYMRFNRSSLYTLGNGTIEVKGTFKNPPQYIQFNFLNKLGDLTYQDLDNLKHIYSDKYYIFLREMGYDLSEYYGFNGKYMSKHVTKFTDKSDVSSAREVLLRFIYPILQLHNSKIEEDQCTPVENS